ncbi:hypothetical protein V6N13_126894 [Hibiscus sabdariffa]|uniref:Uncharacterized protein n=1 Tax=Hibiscus sabdariffa TaxID=183260 RepID=A0ABR2RE29_9ROSI
MEWACHRRYLGLSVMLVGVEYFLQFGWRTEEAEVIVRGLELGQGKGKSDFIIEARVFLKRLTIMRCHLNASRLKRLRSEVLASCAVLRLDHLMH